ncbi:MAG TPA: HlyD family type I secretion periplasmic adaptor subunit [Arsenicitalea sp.]|jgi:adhesin transport system membrane fusion protein|nr:HlyD family type I secretion periplasmic adaptor subunit [Arsenicitalea sp.]
MSVVTDQFGDRVFAINNDRPPLQWLWVVLLVCAFVGSGLIWSALAQIDEMSRADGRVIPSGKTQVIQSAEPGVVDEILVRAGQQVKKGQQLIRLDDTNSASSAGEVGAKVEALQAQVSRLNVEYQGDASKGFVCPDEVKARAPAVCANEANLLNVRADSLNQSKQVLQARVEQRQRELNEALSNKSRLEKSAALASQNLALIEPLAQKALVSKTEYITAQREVNDLHGQIDALVESIARLQAALTEADLQVKQADVQFREDALSQMTLHLAELASAQEQLRGAADRVSRTDIRSPVDGIVNSLDVNTIGAVVGAGTKLLDIVPVSDTLLVEARLKPSDVAFVVPGQEASIKLTAYDFSIFGGLKAIVQNVSADSIVDPQTRETYYLVLLKAEATTLKYRGRELPILPGMVTNVEILTGKKTILQYLLKPINKARDEAMRER